MRGRLFAAAAIISLIVWVIAGYAALERMLPSPGIRVSLTDANYHQPAHPVLATVTRWSLAIVLLACVVAVVLTPILWLRQVRRKAVRDGRMAQGRCPSCGYSLTGNTSGVCPECGAAVPENVEDFGK